MAFIRPFEEKDTEDCKFICRATLPPSLASSAAATAMAPYLWTLQFTHLFPEHCFVLDDGSGRAVGYVIGAPDVFALERRYPEYVEEVLRSEQGLRDVPVPEQMERLEEWWVDDDGLGKGGKRVNERCLAQTAYSVKWLVLEGVEGKRELVEGWRAMLHIDLLGPWQGKGFGREMIRWFLESVEGTRGGEKGYDYRRGLQLGVAGENQGVVKFYEKVGFRVYPGGEKEGNVWMVRDL
ncbi:hypothetical protein QBC40DRAFT_349556 [Triangularia verruculosa]|uniref:N-acetyltransferase domain-containing protein n=1 Tax=Triangularia verruculosa TaxID=2587418 RepID=A0AAN6XEP1_9PEZI|nr:hypothetical protein QBC40DRAFT_349556 [Triangularia verruculosa]